MMLDKLTLTSPHEISLTESCKKLKGLYSKSITTNTKYHSEVKVFYCDEIGGDKKHLLSLHTKPKFHGVSEVKMELNPARYSSFSELLTFVSLIQNPTVLRISRIDHAVDISIPVSEVHKSLLFSRKKSREVYRDGKELTGFYLGNFPEKLSVYNKAKEAGIEGCLTRVELRQHQAKVACKELLELPTLQSFKPFEKLRILSVKLDPRTEDSRQAVKVRYLNEAIQTYGLQGAFKRLNIYSNFNRDFGGLLESRTDIGSLDEKYQVNLRAFFQGFENAK